MYSFSNALMEHWIAKAEPKKEEKKEEKKKVEDDDDDLFGDDDAPVEKKPTPKPQPKKEKKKVIAKSIVTFDVKVYDTETNLDELAKKILEREMDGLVWNNEPKKVEVAYGIFKLNMGCVIEDDKVLTDDIFDPIE